MLAEDGEHGRHVQVSELELVRRPVVERRTTVLEVERKNLSYAMHPRKVMIC